MSPQVLRGIAIGCCVITAICLFVAYERYQTNANNVEAMNQFTASSPLGKIAGGGKLTATIPSATKYAAFLALLSGVGAGVCFNLANRPHASISLVPVFVVLVHARHNLHRASRRTLMSSARLWLEGTG